MKKLNILLDLEFMMRKAIYMIKWVRDILVGILNMMKELKQLVLEFKREIPIQKVNIQIHIVKKILFMIVMISYTLKIIMLYQDFKQNNHVVQLF